MYPNFPAQVMAMGEGELYLNAIVHYLTDGQYCARDASEEERLPLLDNVELQVLDLGNAGRVRAAVRADRRLEHLAVRAGQGRPDVVCARPMARRSPPAARRHPAKGEHGVCRGPAARTHTDRDARQFVGRFCRTATDVLRLAVALSGGDVSLATATQFRSFTRAERRSAAGPARRQPNATEDMLRWKGRWIRLGERLHPGEYARQYPQAAEAFRILRNDVPFPTFNRRVEAALAQRQAQEAVERLRTRAGDFARRLDHLLRLDADPLRRKPWLRRSARWPTRSPRPSCCR